MNRWPATSRVICGVMVTEAAGPGCIEISTRSMTGRVPGTLAIAVTPKTPVDPAETSPELSTRPSNRPPEPTKRIKALATGLPELSTACALKRSVSPAVIVLVSGVIGAKVEPDAEAAKRNPLLNRPGWRVRLAFFPADQKADKPDYELGMLLLDNGISRDMVIDYGDYSIRAKLEDIEALPKPHC